MDHKTQSGDRVKHEISEIDQIITTSEIWFDNLVLPKMEKAIDDKFKLYVVPLNERYKNLNTRLLIKTIVTAILIVVMLLIRSS
jgi:hypothetical protein